MAGRVGRQRMLGSLAVVALAILATPATGADGTARSGQTTVRAMDVTGDTPKPCPAIEVRGTDVHGGCVIHAVNGNIELSVVTAVGRMPFARCESYQTIHIDSYGRTLTEEIGVLGESPCPDVKPCFPGHSRERRERPPWKGQLILRPGGAVEHQVRACFDTCMGRFAGRLVTRVDDTAGLWRARATRGSVGLSGWEIAGGWEWKRDLSSDDGLPTGLALRPAHGG